jgi:hypothetical protein
LQTCGLIFSQSNASWVSFSRIWSLFWLAFFVCLEKIILCLDRYSSRDFFRSTGPVLNAVK